MATHAERTMSATEFKAKCLDVMDQLAARTLDRVVVTKRGRPVMVAAAAIAPDKPDPLAAFGCMKGTIIIPGDLDLTAPVFDADDFDALRDDREIGLSG